MTITVDNLITTSGESTTVNLDLTAKELGREIKELEAQKSSVVDISSFKKTLFAKEPVVKADLEEVTALETKLLALTAVKVSAEKVYIDALKNTNNKASSMQATLVHKAQANSDISKLEKQLLKQQATLRIIDQSIIISKYRCEFKKDKNYIENNQKQFEINTLNSRLKEQKKLKSEALIIIDDFSKLYETSEKAIVSDINSSLLTRTDECVVDCIKQNGKAAALLIEQRSVVTKADSQILSIETQIKEFQKIIDTNQELLSKQQAELDELTSKKNVVASAITVTEKSLSEKKEIAQKHTTSFDSEKQSLITELRGLKDLEVAVTNATIDFELIQKECVAIINKLLPGYVASAAAAINGAVCVAASYLPSLPDFISGRTRATSTVSAESITAKPVL